VAYLALTGVVYPLASVMPELPQERVELLKKTLPPLAIYPVDLFSRGTDMQYDRFKSTTADTYLHNYPEILDLKINAASGIYDVVGVTNWRSGDWTRHLDFGDQLGLPPGPYAVFDFWNEKLLGVFNQGLDVQVHAHDTAVLAIHPALEHPQLMGTSRHISGAYSIEAQEWNPGGNLLHGRSQTIPGSTYVLWVRVPAGFSLSGVTAKAGQMEVAVKTEQNGELLSLLLPGQQEAVDWRVNFVSK
jgi:hypothetical protein